MMNRLLACPKCYGSLFYGKDSIDCLSCKLSFPLYAGIPDFRCVNPFFQPSQKEEKIREALLSVYHTASFEQLIEKRYSYSKRHLSKLNEQQKAFELSFKQKGIYRSFQIKKLLKDNGRPISEKGIFLDIGCGSGTSIPWIMEGFQGGVGVDYSLIDLIMGNKFLQERGISNILLICADARKLPFPSGIFDFANATDVIEHIVPGTEEFIGEVGRALKKGGGFYFNSPNRFNIFTPEPHVKIRFVGFVPRFLMDRYVKMIKGIHYNTVHLLSLIELKTLVKKVFGGNFVVSGPFIDVNAPATDVKRKVMKRFPFLLSFINRTFLFFTTNYQVMAFKTSD